MEQLARNCGDCGAPLQGPFCARCGQKASDYHRSVHQLLVDFGRDFFTVEAKLFQTLKRLVLKPGDLTRAYFEGKRTRYVTPLKLYLFISVMFFFLRTVVFQPDTARITANVEKTTARMTEVLVSLGENEAENEEIRREVNNNKVITKILALQEAGRLAPFMVAYFNRIPTLMFLMMPIFALVLRLLYIRHGERFYYFEHLIFSLHIHALFFLIGSLGVVLPSFGLKSLLVTSAIIVYLFCCMRAVYGQGRFKTLLKWALLVVVYGIVSFFAVSLLMLISLARA